MTDKRQDINGEELDENTQVSEPSEEEVLESEEVVDEVSEPITDEEEVLDSEVVDSTDEEVSESDEVEEEIEGPTTNKEDADNPNRKRGAGRDIIYSTQNANKEAEEKAEKKRREERKKREEEAEFDKNYVKKISEKEGTPEIKKVKVGDSKKLAFLKKKQTWIAAAVIVVLVLAFVAKSVLGGGSSKENFFTVLNTILNSDGGQFSYTITVNSGKHTDKGIENKSYSKDEDLNAGTEGVTETTQTAEPTEVSSEPKDTTSSILDSTKDADNEKTLTAKTEEWDDRDENSLTEWKYPNYTIKLTGGATSVSPYTAKINVVLATESFSDSFTDIIAVEDNYYINVEQMKYWLENSKDSYLVSLSEQMPEGSKYIHIGKDDFKIPSRYAEDGEKDLSGVTGLYSYKKELLTLINMVCGTVQNYCSFDSNSKDGYLVSAQGESGADIANAIKSLVTNSGNTYDAYINQFELSDDAKKQKVREKDNFISAMSKAMTYMNLTTADAMNFSLNGNALTLVNGDNNQQYEANMSINYTLNDTDYAISITAQRVGATVDEIVAPTESVSDSLMTFSDILNITDNVTDYFNFTDIELEKKLEPTPENSINTALQNFVDLVNENNCYDKVLSVHNVMEFLQKYSNIKERDAENDNDKACIILTNDFLDKFDKLLVDARKQIVKDDITGKETDINNEDETKDEKEDVEQYPEVDTTIDGADVTFKVNEKKSNAKLLVVDMIIDNHTDTDVTFDTTLFQVKTLLGSVYPANNQTLLGGFDATWYDKYDDKVDVKKTVSANSSDDTTLYFVISDDNGYMDIWYNDSNLGVLVQY